MYVYEVRLANGHSDDGSGSMCAGAVNLDWMFETEDFQIEWQ